MASVSTIMQHVAAPQETAFAVFTDLAGTANHIDAIKKIEILTPLPVGNGTRWRETRLIHGRDCTEELEITAFDAPALFAAEAASAGTHYVTTFTFEPAGDGATEVTMAFEAHPQKFVARVLGLLMAPFVRRMMLNALEDDLKALGAAAEKRAAVLG